LVVAVLVMMVLSFLGMAIMTLSVTEHSMAYNAVWGEGAFAAAEAGINAGINQLSANATTATNKIPISGSNVPIGTGFTYRSGGKSDASPQPVKFVKTRTEPGYSVAIGTGYNPAGYAFNSYQINATGTGPKNAVRELEVQAEYGPVAQ
jgi:Tfp pilus assembly protein PilX